MNKKVGRLTNKQKANKIEVELLKIINESILSKDIIKDINKISNKDIKTLNEILISVKNQLPKMEVKNQLPKMEVNKDEDNNRKKLDELEYKIGELIGELDLSDKLINDVAKKINNIKKKKTITNKDIKDLNKILDKINKDELK